ncbi:MAG TPA: NAD(P)/FAD-dependent oxidoreductase [Roseiflexaceae bacterium]|nr:NAD(P)/FAD-dependent oxidoreductase [Roseiflexaceae bacterium]
MYDLIILGGGAAGLAAAAYAQSKQLDILIIAEQIGGKAGTQQHLPNQPGEQELLGADMVQLLAQRTAARAAQLHDRVIGIAKSNGIFEIETQHHGVQRARAALVATGAAPLPLDVPGAQRLVNHGIGYSITTHAGLLAGKTVTVIGNTRRALRGTMELARLDTQVYLIATEAAGMTTPLGQMLRHTPQVTIFEGYQVKQIAGDTNVEYIVIEREGEQSRLRVDAVFADLGLLPNSGLVRPIAQLDAEGFIVVDEHSMTTLPGLFAAGDVTTAFAENILVAIGAGTRAAISAHEYVLARTPMYTTESAD